LGFFWLWRTTTQRTVGSLLCPESLGIVEGCQTVGVACLIGVRSICLGRPAMGAEQVSLEPLTKAGHVIVLDDRVAYLV